MTDQVASGIVLADPQVRAEGGRRNLAHDRDVAGHPHAHVECRVVVGTGTVDCAAKNLHSIAFSWYGKWCDSQLDAKFAWSDVSSLFEDESFHTTFFGTAGARKADKATASTRLGPNNQNNGWPRTCGMSNASDIIGGNGSYSLPQTSGASWGALLD